MVFTCSAPRARAGAVRYAWHIHGEENPKHMVEMLFHGRACAFLVLDRDGGDDPLVVSLGSIPHLGFHVVGLQTPEHRAILMAEQMLDQ